MIYSLSHDQLGTWVQTKAKPGDIALWLEPIEGTYYIYGYKGPDENPFWMPLLYKDQLDNLLDSVDDITCSDSSGNEVEEYPAILKGAKIFAEHLFNNLKYMPLQDIDLDFEIRNLLKEFEKDYSGKAIERSLGTWRLETDEECPNPMFKLVVCSNCEEPANDTYRFCPHCGQEMLCELSD